MGNTDSIPIISQAKSLVQVIAGDKEGAKRTQENFLNTAPVFSQAKSAVQAISGDTKGAKETQEAFAKSLGSFADGIPVIGHIKGGIEYAIGDTEAGDASMKAASRTVGVVAGGAAGFFVGGPAGAVLGGVAAGAAMDGIITGVDSAVHHEYRPYGEVSAVTNMANGHFDAGQGFDFTAGLAFDAIAGLGEAGEGSLTQRFSEHVDGKPVYTVMNEARADAALRDNALPLSHIGNEVWISESTEHTRPYMLDDQQYRTHAFDVKVDKAWYERMRDEDTVLQEDAANNRGKNVWNDERLPGHTPGHGAINIGIKTVARERIWGIFEERLNGLQDLKNLMEEHVGEDVPVDRPMQKFLGRQFGGGGNRPVPLLRNLENLAVQLENTETLNVLQAANDGAARIRQGIQNVVDLEMAERFNARIQNVTFSQRDIVMIGEIQDILAQVQNEVRGSDNLSVFNNHIKSIRLIDPYRFKYKARDFMKEITRKNPKSYVTAVASVWGINRDEFETKGSKDIEPAPHEYNLANSTQIYTAPEKIVVNGHNGTSGPLMSAPLTVGALPVKRIEVKGAAQVFNRRRNTSQPTQILMRMHRRGLPDSYHDVDISGAIGETEKSIHFSDSNVGLENLGIGGTIDFLCSINREEELHITNLTCEVTFGDTQFSIVRSRDHSTISFTPARSMHMRNSISSIVPLFEEMIPLGDSTILGATASFRAKDQGWGNMKGRVYLRIWDENNFVDYPLTGTLNHSWIEYSWNSDSIANFKNNIPMGARAQLMCTVGGGGGHELFVDNMVLKFKIGRPQRAIENSIIFVRESVMNSTRSDNIVPLFEDKIAITDDLRGIKIRFRAKDQGWGNRKGHVVMRIEKPSGSVQDVFLHDNVLEHEWKAYEYNSSRVAQENIQKGDTVQFMCKVGGGGGHELYIEQLNAEFTLRDTTRIFAPAKPVDIFNSTDELVPLYEEKIPCGVNALKRARITLRAKDQGWGNIKGKIYLRVWANGVKNIVRDIEVASINHNWNTYTYNSPADIQSLVPPGSVIQFMVKVGGGGGHEVHIENFVSQLTFSDAPRDEIVTNSHSPPTIACGAKVKSLNTTSNTSDIVVKVIKHDGSTRTTFPLANHLDANFFNPRVAIGDRLRFEGPIPANFKVTASFLPLEIPDHENVVVHFTDRINYWGFIHGKEATNILDDDQGLELKMKLRALTVSCTWTDDNPEEESTGKLILLLKDANGNEKGRYDVFGTVTHDWVHKMRVFNSESDLVRSATEGDKLQLMREIGDNGELHVDNLDMYLMLTE